MSKLKAAALVILAILAATMLPAVIYGYSAKAVAFNEDFYIKEFESRGIYSGASAAVGYALPEASVKKLVDEFLGRILAYFRGDADLDLKIKSGDILSEDDIRNYIRSLSPCESEAKMPCIPPGVTAEQLISETEKSAEQTVNIADRIPGIESKLAEAKSLFRNIFGVLDMLLLSLTVIFVLAVAIARKSAVKWFGSVLLISGIASLAITLVVPVMVPAALAQAGGNAVTAIITDVVQAISNSAMIYSAALIAAGIVLYFASRKIKPAKSETKQKKK